MKIRRKKRTEAPSFCRFSKRAEYSDLAQRKNLLSFFISFVKTTKVFRIGETLVRYLRRFRIVTATLRLFPWVLLLINTNTLLYAVAGVAFILLPLIVVGLISLLASASIHYRKLNAKMISYLEGAAVYVFFPTRGGEFSNGCFWRGNILDIAARKQTVVLVISPFLLSPRGLIDGKLYFGLREETPNVLLVRRHYFFSLQKNVLPRLGGKQFLIY